MIGPAIARAAVGVLAAGRQGRGLVQRLEVVVRPPHQREHPGGRVGVGEGRDAGAVEDLLAGPDRLAAHPAREHGLAGDVGVFRQRRAVAVGSLIACGVRITSNPSMAGSSAATSSARAYRVASASPRMSIGLAWLQADGRKASRIFRVVGVGLASSPPALDQGVGGQDAGPAGVGDDRQLGPARPRLLGQHVGHVEDLRDRVDPQHADAAERGIEHLVAAGHRAGVRRRGLRRRLGPPRLDHDDRLGERHLAPPRGTPAHRRSTPCRSRCTSSRGRPPGSRSGRPSRRRASSRSRRTR